MRGGAVNAEVEDGVIIMEAEATAGGNERRSSGL